MAERYSKFIDLLKNRGMGYEFESMIIDGELICQISFGFLGSNYKETGWICLCNKNESTTYELQERTYDYAIELIEKFQTEKDHVLDSFIDKHRFTLGKP